MSSGRSDLVEIDAEIGWETEAAYGLDTGRLDRRGQKLLTWVPKRYVDYDGCTIFTMPEWIAHDKGLI